MKRNIFLFKLSNFLFGFWPMNVLAIVYFQQITQSYTVAMSVFSILHLSTTFMEIPTGIFSDRIGRKKSLMLGALMTLTCFLSWAVAGWWQMTSLLFLGAFLKGIGDSFISGTDEAFMYETMKQIKQEKKFDILYAKAAGWTQSGQALSALTAAVITYFFDLKILAWISIIPAIFNIGVIMGYTDIAIKKSKRRDNVLAHFLTAFQTIIKNRKLRFYSIIQMCYEALGNASYYFEGAYYETLISKWLINVVRFIKQSFGVISFFIVPKIRWMGMDKLYFISMFGNAFIRMIGVLINTTISPFVICFGTLFYGSTRTSGTTLLQREFTQNQRATMKSVISLGASLLTAVIMYLLGIIADYYTPQIGLLSAIIPILILVSLSAMIFHHKLHKV